MSVSCGQVSELETAAAAAAAVESSRGVEQQELAKELAAKEEALAARDQELTDLKAEMAALKDEHEELLMVLAENGDEDEEAEAGGE